MPDGGASPTRPTVFVVIPVFNRLQFTLACLDHLRAQTYSPLRLIVADGGSSDGTVETLRRDQPDVVVLQGPGELWWAGAMRIGIEYALAQSRNPDDFVLMMNDDTVIGPEYVETLVRVFHATGAAVGALIVDVDDPSRILRAGDFIDWSTYDFPVKTTIAPGETQCDRVDVLPGRGTLVPLQMIRVAGNIDDKSFPHYIADYEFSVRLRRHGFRLVVTYETAVRAHSEATGLLSTSEPLSFREAWDLLFSIKSMQNVRDHWRFIDRCAPQQERARLKRRLLRQSAALLATRTPLRFLLLGGQTLLHPRRIPWRRPKSR